MSRVHRKDGEQKMRNHNYGRMPLLLGKMMLLILIWWDRIKMSNANILMQTGRVSADIIDPNSRRVSQKEVFQFFFSKSRLGFCAATAGEDSLACAPASEASNSEEATTD